MENDITKVFISRRENTVNVFMNKFPILKDSLKSIETQDYYRKKRNESLNNKEKSVGLSHIIN